MVMSLLVCHVDITVDVMSMSLLVCHVDVTVGMSWRCHC